MNLQASTSADSAPTDTAAADTADAVVIGAGIIGSAVALELARRGLDVVCVDKLAGPGFGSTSASVAIVRFHYSTRSGVALAWESLHTWHDWEHHVSPGDHEALARFVSMPMLTPIEPDQPKPPYIEHFDALGVPYTLATPGELAERWPDARWGRHGPAVPLDDLDAPFWDDPDRYFDAVLVSEDAGYITDPALAARNLADAAVAAGARFRFRAEVVSVERSGHDGDSRVTGVTLADGTSIGAPVVVNVAGPHSAIVNDLAGVAGEVARPNRPLRREVYHAPAPAPDFESTGFMLGDLDVGVYCRPESGNNVLLGSTEPACDPLVFVDDPDSLDDTISGDNHQLHLLRLARRFPDMGIPPHKHGLVALYDATPDWTPIYDRSSVNGYYMACGTSGNQFKNGPTAGWLMAELITAVEAGHDHDAEPLVLTTPRTGLEVDTATFSRLRAVDEAAGHSVLG